MSDSTQQTAVVVDHLKQWKLSSPRKPSRLVPKLEFGGPADRNYNLKNKLVRKFLQHEKQAVGIDLGWTDDAEPDTARRVARWFVARNATATTAIRYGETVALGNGNIHHERRTAGVDLDWSRSPNHLENAYDDLMGRR